MIKVSSRKFDRVMDEEWKKAATHSAEWAPAGVVIRSVAASRLVIVDVARRFGVVGDSGITVCC